MREIGFPVCCGLAMSYKVCHKHTLSRMEVEARKQMGLQIEALVQASSRMKRVQQGQHMSISKYMLMRWISMQHAVSSWTPRIVFLYCFAWFLCGQAEGKRREEASPKAKTCLLNDRKCRKKVAEVPLMPYAILTAGVCCRCVPTFWGCATAATPSRASRVAIGAALAQHRQRGICALP